MDLIEFEKKKLEYVAAQEMLRHYDSLNWQIGSILIAGVIVLTGLVVNKDIVVTMQQSHMTAWTLILSIPVFSAFVLITWWLWFRRHRDLYNLRNEVLHRLERELGMYHFLRVVEADPKSKPDVGNTLIAAKKAAGYDGFEPLYGLSKLTRPSGSTLVAVLAFGIPFIQFLLLFFLAFASPGQIKTSEIQTQPATSQSATSPTASPFK
jgi:hypothetical protein